MTTATKTQYKHGEFQLDPRDKTICSYDEDDRRFVAEESDLEARGIGQQYVTNTHANGGADYYIYLWSEKFNLAIPYKACDFVTNPHDTSEIIASVWKPCFATILDRQTALAAAAAEGTELHLLND